MSRRLSFIFIIVLFVMCLQQAFFNFSFVTEFINSNKIQYAYGQVKSITHSIPSVTPEEVNSKDSVYFLGDVMLARDVERKLINYGASYPYKNITFDKDTDFVLANFEAAIPKVHIPTRDNTFRFSVNKNFLVGLSEAGVTHVSLANNHSFDYGVDGYNNSLLQITENKMAPFGHPSKISTSSVVFLETNNKTVSVIAVHTLFLSPDTKDLLSTIDYARSLSDIVVVYVHWGEEYSPLPSKSQVRLAQLLSEHGVDIVIGHHPHVIQSIERIGDTIVFYSLGNFIFDQYFSTDVQTGLVLKLNLQDESSLELLPVTSLGNRAQPSYLEPDQKADFLENLTKNSAQGLKNEIQNGVIFLPKKLASSTELVIMAE